MSTLWPDSMPTRISLAFFFTHFFVKHNRLRLLSNHGSKLDDYAIVTCPNSRAHMPCHAVRPQKERAFVYVRTCTYVCVWDLGSRRGAGL